MTAMDILNRFQSSAAKLVVKTSDVKATVKDWCCSYSDVTPAEADKVANWLCKAMVKLGYNELNALTNPIVFAEAKAIAKKDLEGDPLTVDDSIGRMTVRDLITSFEHAIIGNRLAVDVATIEQELMEHVRNNNLSVGIAEEERAGYALQQAARTYKTQVLRSTNITTISDWARSVNLSGEPLLETDSSNERLKAEAKKAPTGPTTEQLKALLQTAYDRLYDVMRNDDGQAWKEGRKLLEAHAPELAEKLDGASNDGECVLYHLRSIGKLRPDSKMTVHWEVGATRFGATTKGSEFESVEKTIGSGLITKIIIGDV